MIEDHTKESEEIASVKAEQAAAKSSRPIMRVKVYSPYRTYYDEDSYSISAQNATGPFDILAHHHNFLTLLNPGDLVIKPVNGVQEQKIRISGGLMHVKADKVTVF